MLWRHVGTVFVVVVLLGLLGLAIWIMIAVWTSTDARMSGHGWTALILGVFFSCAVGFGLMALIFFSSRRGYDEPPTFNLRDDDDKGPYTVPIAGSSTVGGCFCAATGLAGDRSLRLCRIN
jgi:hypothetical protein